MSEAASLSLGSGECRARFLRACLCVCLCECRPPNPPLAFLHARTRTHAQNEGGKQHRRTLLNLVSGDCAAAAESS